MSFLAEVIKSAEHTELQSIEQTLQTIEKKLQCEKDEINTYLEDMYVKYCTWSCSNNKKLQEMTNLTNEITNLQNRVEKMSLIDIQEQQASVQNLKDELNRSNIAADMLMTLIQLHEKVVLVKDLNVQGMYNEATNEFIEIDLLVNNLLEKGLSEVVEGIMLTIMHEKTYLVNVVKNELPKLLSVKAGKAAVLQTNSLKISTNNELENLLNMMGSLNMIDMNLSEFIDLLWRWIIKPTINNITTVQTHTDENYNTLTVTVKKTNLDKLYKEVFDQLLEIFKFLRAHLNYVLRHDETSILFYIGENLKKRLANVLLNDYLGSMLPKNSNEYGDYKQLINDTNAFQQQLVEFGILKEEGNIILDYISDMNSSLGNIYCEEYSAEATTIMKKDLHHMVEVGEQSDPAIALTGSQFPECSISKSTIELLKLAQKMLQQALQEPNAIAARLICTMQSFFYQYGSIVYVHHEKLLQSIPQQVVLYRNNCMYLAHQLTELNKCYSSKFSKEALPLPPIFKDQPHQLRTVGGDIFLGFVEVHIESIEQTLVKYNFTPQSLAETLPPDMGKSIRQCLRQYELLRTVWHKILPHAVYNKTIGYMLNFFCKRLIATVVAAPDISIYNSKLIVDMYKVIINRGPKLFTDSEEVNLYVECWQRFHELVFVLGATMAEITNKWQTETLSAHFTIDEVKHLIKALFQNTDRRAHALSLIVNSVQD
ncbi:hypothetical protein FQA39_LY16175 [Lamprigera yunnana]|nr:hypothetical protein FQA39_LY16175 [Lamprigera yunnana]